LIILAEKFDGEREGSNCVSNESMFCDRCRSRYHPARSQRDGEGDGDGESIVGQDLGVKSRSVVSEEESSSQVIVMGLCGLCEAGEATVNTMNGFKGYACFAC
jgi:hypothetical protein